MNRNFKILLVILTLVVLIILRDFILPTILGAFLAVVLSKPTSQLNLKIKNYKLSAILTIAICGIMFFLPIMFFVISGISELVLFINQGGFQSIIGKTQIYSNDFMPKISEYIPFSLEKSQDTIKQIAIFLSQKIGGYLQSFVLNLPSILLDWLIIIVTTNYFLIEKDKILSMISKNKIFSFEETSKLSKIIVSVTQGVIIASVISGFLQAIAMGILSAMITNDLWLVVAILTFVFSFIPIVGTAPITLFFLTSSFIQGNTTHTILILITISMMFVIDNLIKPLLIGKQTHIHPVLAFMSALGGLTLFGFYGLFLGSIAVGILIDLIRE